MSIVNFPTNNADCKLQSAFNI